MKKIPKYMVIIVKKLPYFESKFSVRQGAEIGYLV